MEIKNIAYTRVTLKGKIKFIADGVGMEMEAKEAFKIAYALFDWARQDIEPLEEIRRKMKED